MKTIIIFFAAIILSATIFAQSPDKISYQAVVRDASGNLISNKTIGIRISILQSSVNGTAVYVEIQKPTTNVNGLLNIVIGNGKAVSGNFSSINWEKGPYFIKTEIDINGEENYTISGTSQILSVPYALHAKTAETITGTINETDPVFSSSAASGINTINIAYWNSKLDAEEDGSVTNELQNLDQVLTLGADAGNKRITNLAAPVNAGDAVTKAYIDEMLIQAGVYTVKDIDGNIYNTIKIGTQIWMAEDLRVTHYPNGDAIPHITDNTAWGNLDNNNTDDAYCFYKNNNGTDYGALYTYAAAIGDNWARDNTAGQGVCPDGWHLPTDAEWTTLTDYLGGTSVAGGKMKETGFTHWDIPNTGATNESGFSALPGGYRGDGDGSFFTMGYSGYWWSSTEGGSSDAHIRYLDYYNEEAYPNIFNKSCGFSVRCVKD